MRWQRTATGLYVLQNDAGEIVACIRPDYVVSVRNRAGGWNYGFAPSLRSAKRRARVMIREERG